MHDTQRCTTPYYVLLSFAAANRLGYGPDNARGILLMAKEDESKQSLRLVEPKKSDASCTRPQVFASGWAYLGKPAKF